MIRFMGVMFVIPATLLLTLSFFVGFASRKLDAQDSLRKFGGFVAGLLWVCAGLAVALGLYTVVTGQHPLVVFIREVGRAAAQP